MSEIAAGMEASGKRKFAMGVRAVLVWDSLPALTVLPFHSSPLAIKHRGELVVEAAR